MKKKFLIKNRLEPEDWQELFPFFFRKPFDHAAYARHVEATYAEVPELGAVLRVAGQVVADVQAGAKPDLSEIKLLQAKQLLSILVTSGKMLTARAMLEVAKEVWKPDRFRAHDALLLDGSDNDGDIEKVDEVWMDFQVLDFGSDTTFILFCGIAGRFGVELNVMLQWLRPLGVNVVYLRDHSNLLYLKGIESLGNEAETAAGLKEALAKLNSKRVICVGNSGGSFGALYYGHLIGADQIICFAGPTSLDAGTQQKGDRPVYEIIHSLAQKGEINEPDVIALYGENKIAVRYFLGDQSDFDLIQAERIKHLPTVSVEPLVNWDGHFVIGELARRGHLKGILKQAAEGLTPLDSPAI